MRLYALCSIYEQQGAFAGSEGTAHFIAEIYVAGGIYQVEGILLAFIRVIDLYGMAFYGDAFFPLQVHIIQYLGMHIPVAYGAGALQQPVCQCTFPVIYMCNDAKIPDVLH